MRFMRFHRAFLVAVVVVALAAGLASAHGGASAQAPATDTVTTELRPGWNLIGWMGPDTTPAADLFDKIPGLQVVAAWDEDAGRYAWARRGGSVPPELAQLTRGQALFLWVSGTEVVEWSRPASAAGILLSLPSGYSLVGWAGLDGTPIEEAVGRFGDALVGASRWNAETQSYERYEPGVEEPAEGMPVLQHGDALWVELSAERRWWQSGTERTRFVFEGAVTPSHESELREEMEHAVAFFAERYGIEPPNFFVLVDPGLDIHADAAAGKIRVGGGGVDHPLRESFYAHEYFHILQHHLGQQRPSADGSPVWLTEGTAEYAADVYRREREGWTDDRVRTAWWRRSLGVSAPLSDLEDSQPFYALDRAGYDLGTLATDWLVRRAAALSDNAPFTPLEPGGLELREEYDAHLQYYRLLPPSGSWQQAFEAAFGIDVNDFYAAFEEYRTALTASRLPHFADDEDMPILVFEGGIPADTAARIRAQFDSVQALIRERFRGGPTDYTVFVAADAASAAAAHLRVSGEELEQGRCGVWRPQHSVVDLACQTRIVTHLAWNAVTRVSDRLAPLESLPPVAEGYRPRGAAWLTNGLARYVEAVSRETAGIETLVETWNRNIASASHTGQPLRSMTTYADMNVAGRLAGFSVSFLAVEWLAEQAGEPALFEYYRLLPISDSWQEAFEGAFGITVEEFYAAFEAYRGEVAPPLPHLTDDVDAPILVFVAEIPEETTARIRAQFEAVQAVLRERFGSGPVDYTVFVAADAAAAAAAHFRVSGEELEEGRCGSWQSHYYVMDLACQPRAVSYLTWNHFTRVVERLAPRDSLPPAVEGYREHGAGWLINGLARYVEAVSRETAGIETLVETRNRNIVWARRTGQPLREMEASAGVDAAGSQAANALSFLAGEWLAERAGEPALFEYYRLLPSSRNWQEAFEGAFGIAIDDFYAEFEAYRADGFTS